MKNAITNWKTTLAGLIIAGVTVAISLHYITPEIGTQIIAIAGSFGLVLAQDGSKPE